MSDLPYVSLVICTRNRADRLRSCLGYIRRMSYPVDRWELVIVDNCSTDATADVIREFSRSSSARVISLTEPAAGLGRARNTGLEATSGEIIAFTDDDCYPAENYLQAVAAAFERADLAFIGGRVELFSPDDAPVTITTGRPEQDYEPGCIIPAGAIHGANMAFRREVFRRLGGFNELLGAGTRFPAEDVEFLTRASLAGYRGAYLTDPCVWHHHGRKQAEVTRLQRGYAWGRGAYYTSILLTGSRARAARAWGRHTIRNLRRRQFHLPAIELVAGLLYAATYCTSGSAARRFPPSW